MYPEHWTVDGNRTVALHATSSPNRAKRASAHPEAFNYTTDLFADAAIGWLRGRSSAAILRVSLVHGASRGRLGLRAESAGAGISRCQPT